MKAVFMIALVLMTSACARSDIGLARPVEVPALPSSLSQRATALPPITDRTLNGLATSHADTSIRYNDVGHRLNTLINFYDCVRRSLKAGTDVKGCLPD